MIKKFKKIILGGMGCIGLIALPATSISYLPIETKPKEPKSKLFGKMQTKEIKIVDTISPWTKKRDYENLKHEIGVLPSGWADVSLDIRITLGANNATIAKHVFFQKQQTKVVLFENKTITIGLDCSAYFSKVLLIVENSKLYLYVLKAKIIGISMEFYGISHMDVKAYTTYEIN